MQKRIHDREQVTEIVSQCLNHYQNHCQKGERFGAILERTGLEDFLKNAKKQQNFDLDQGIRGWVSIL